MPEAHAHAGPSELPVAVITGASSGIGAALAVELSAAGHAVALIARGAERLEQVAAVIRQAGGQVLVVPADVADRAAVLRALEVVGAWRGRLDIVVANAGVYRRGLATELTRERIEAAFCDNFWTAFHLAEAALPRLVVQRSGHLVFVNSFDAKKGLPMDAAYVTAKAALAGYVGTLRQALRPAGVHVCSVFPGRVDTPMLDQLDVPWVSAKIPAVRVAKAIVRAIRRRTAEVIVPWHLRLLWWVDVLSPRLGDWLVATLRLDGRSHSS